MAERMNRIREAMRGPSIGAPNVQRSSATDRRYRPAWAEIDLDAIRHNVRALRAVSGPAALCAVVKADGYGHGAAEAAKAALAGGAVGVAVALVEEGIALKEAGFEAPILLLSEPPPGAMRSAIASGISPTLYSAKGIEDAALAARDIGSRLRVHLKVDTGMHRVGADPSAMLELAQMVGADQMLELEGVWTHLAVADGVVREDVAFTNTQLDRFNAVVKELAGADIAPPILHAANSAGSIVFPEARFNFVRCGIAIYGELPGPAVSAAFAAASPTALRPALSLKASVSAVRELAAGERPSYGRVRPLPERSIVATVPLGYADGVPRALLQSGFEVLIGGRRCPLAGTVTMDQIVVDCGPNARVEIGDEVVLLGTQGSETITATEWADRLGTISYEVLCGIGARVPREHVGGTGATHAVTTSPQQTF